MFFFEPQIITPADEYLFPSAGVFETSQLIQVLNVAQCLRPAKSPQAEKAPYAKPAHPFRGLTRVYWAALRFAAIAGGA